MYLIIPHISDLVKTNKIITLPLAKVGKYFMVVIKLCQVKGKKRERLIFLMMQKTKKASQCSRKRQMLNVALSVFGIALLTTAPVFADNCETGILPETWCGDDGLMVMVKDIIWILSSLVYLLGALAIVICGVIWMTSTGDPGKVATAKRRLVEIAIGIVCFIALDLIVWFLGIGS